MMNRFTLVSVTSLLFIAPSAFAFTPPNLQNLDSGQVDAVFKDFGANLIFKPLEPASTYSTIAGFSFGIIGTLTDSSAIRNNIPGTDSLSYVPDAQIYLGAQLPLGLAAEFGFFPTYSVGGFKVHSVGGDLKWTMSEVLAAKKEVPVDVAFRAMVTNSGISYGQTISGVSDTISYATTSWGTNFSISKKIALLEPYIGLGYIHTSGTLSDTGSITLFQQSVSLTDSFSDTNSGVWFYGGLQLNFILCNFTAEYDDIYGVGAGAIKFGFKF